MSMRSITCQSCGNAFEVRVTRLRSGNRHKPKYCSSRCYGNARTLTDEERKLRKSKRNRESYLRRKKAGKKDFTSRTRSMSTVREADYL